MSTGLRLGEYAATPLYNIKAVVQATGISPSTLRAWERRYNVAHPQRSDSGYRLYSERDVAVIRWLKVQVDAGMAISQAVAWLEKLTTGTLDQAVLPLAGGAPQHDPLGTLPGPQREGVRDLATLQYELLLALMNFDEEGADEALTEAFSLYTLEQIGDKLFMPALLEISERHRHGELGITMAQFAGAYLRQRLESILRFTRNNTSGPLIWVGSTRATGQDASALLLAIYLRRAGYHVHYLGQDLAGEEDAVKDLVHETKRYQPALILLSAGSLAAAGESNQLYERLMQANHLPAIVAYSGLIYANHPELRPAGLYVGARAKEVIIHVDELLADKHRVNRKRDKKNEGNLAVSGPETEREAGTNSGVTTIAKNRSDTVAENGTNHLVGGMAAKN